MSIDTPLSLAVKAAENAMKYNPFPEYFPFAIQEAIKAYEAAKSAGQPVEMPSESGGQLLQRLGMDGKLWAEEMHKRFPSIAEDDLLGWCCNMIMAGFDEAERRARKREYVCQKCDWRDAKVDWFKTTNLDDLIINSLDKSKDIEGGN